MERSLWRHHALNKRDVAGTEKKSAAQEQVASDDDCWCEERKSGDTDENAAADRKQGWRASLLTV